MMFFILCRNHLASMMFFILCRNHLASMMFIPTLILTLTLLSIVHVRSELGAEVITSTINGIPASQVVTVGSSGNFTTITEAVTYIQAHVQKDYFKMVIDEGIYRENVVIPEVLRLIIVGAGIGRTVITGNRSVGAVWQTTYQTATFAVQSTGFIACDISFENTAGPDKNQAVAVLNNADRSVFYRCSFLGYQDTLYAYRGVQFYRDCDVYGTVDFIFGDAPAVFQNCNIYSRQPRPGQKNTITAQGRQSLDSPGGISIHNCSILAAPDLDVSTTKTYLGRPWKIYSTTVFIQSFIGSHIDPAGWLEWNDNVGLDTLDYGEYGNYGPGSQTTGRVKWPGYKIMNRSSASRFTVDEFIHGESWLKNTSIPFIPGLL